MAEYYENVVEAQFSLIICGEQLPFENLSSAIGLVPTRTIRKGEIISRLPEIRAQEDAWYHTIELSSPEGGDPALLGMLKTIADAKEKIFSVIAEGDKVIMRLYVNSDKAVMGYQFTPNTLEAITRIGLPLDVTSVSWGDVGI